jgi:multidrug efflux pump subunit AcrB
VPGGTITAGGKDVVLRTKGEFASIDEIGNVILRSKAAQRSACAMWPRSWTAYEDRTTTTRLNGVDA